MNVLLYDEVDDKDSRKLIEEALNESIELAPEYTSKFDTLMKILTDTEDNEMILLLQPQLEHFRLNKSKYGGSYKVAEYDKSSLKQYNISCFYALCLTELRDGKYLINKSYFREFQWITHLDNRLHTKVTFPNKF